MTDHYDPWYVCWNDQCHFETNSERNALNHELEGGTDDRNQPAHPVWQVEG